MNAAKAKAACWIQFNPVGFYLTIICNVLQLFI